MRRIILFFLLLSSIQGRAQLNTRETVEYIDQRFKYLTNLQRTYYPGLSYRLSDLAIGADARNMAKIIIGYTRNNSDKTVEDLQYVFDPTHITTITASSDASDDTIGLIEIKFLGNTVLAKSRKLGEVTDTNKTSFIFPYLRTEPLEFERIKAAFLNLKKLYSLKKTPDPFAN